MNQQLKVNQDYETTMNSVDQIIYSYLKIGYNHTFNQRYFIKIYFVDTSVTIIVKPKTLFKDNNIIIYSYLYGLIDKKVMPLYSQAIRSGDDRSFHLCSSSLAQSVINTVKQLESVSNTFNGMINIYTNMDMKIPDMNFDILPCKSKDFINICEYFYKACKESVSGDYLKAETLWAVYPNDPEYKSIVTYELYICVADVMDNKLYYVFQNSPTQSLDEYPNNPLDDSDLLKLLSYYFNDFIRISKFLVSTETLTTTLYRTAQEERI